MSYAKNIPRPAKQSTKPKILPTKKTKKKRSSIHTQKKIPYQNRLFLKDDRSPTVKYAHFTDGFKRELPSFVINLNAEFSGGRENDRDGLSRLLERQTIHVMLEDVIQDRKQEGGRLAGTRLRAAHQVSPAHDDRYGVLLNRGRVGIAGVGHVAQQERPQARLRERRYLRSDFPCPGDL